MNVHLIGSGFSHRLGYPTGKELWSELTQVLDAWSASESPMDQAEITARAVLPRPRDSYLYNAWRSIRDWCQSEESGILGSSLTKETDMEMLLTQLLVASGTIEADLARQLQLGEFVPSGEQREQRGEQLLWTTHVIATGLSLYFVSRHSAEEYESNGGAPLVRSWLECCIAPGDVILTTNYDLVLEQFLWAASRWSPNDGYGMRFTVVDEIGRFFSELSQAAALNSPSDTRILKLHGSAGWYINTDTGTPFVGMDLLSGVGIMGRDHGGLPNEFKYESSVLVQPGYVKERQIGPNLEHVWSQAAVALQTAERLYVIGYSFPPPDRAIRKLLGASVGSTTSVLVVDPSSVPAERLREFVPGPVDHVVRTFGEWVAEGCRQ